MMVIFQFFLLVSAVVLSLSGIGFTERSGLSARIHQLAEKQGLVIIAVGCATFLGCIGFACVLHEPVPRVHDEFSYLLMSDTFVAGRVSNLSPPMPEFFDTFHILMRPVYASKYFPAQGLFLAVGEKLTGHPAVGLWLSSALACAATCWMLQAWVGSVWGLLGGFLIVIQIGVYSYWSQSYWGGMVAALGGALFFGAIRRLWERLSWQNSFWLAIGLVILANSRPVEGLLAALPTMGLLAIRLGRERQWKHAEFWKTLVLPAGTILLLGATATCTYNHAITGSPWKPPYLLHEQQYQESPQFSFLPLRPKITYSSPWLQYYYEVSEMRLYLSQQTPRNVMITAARKLMTWWAFYCGILLSAPLLLPGLLRGGRIRYLQIAVLAGFILVATVYSPRSVSDRMAIDLFALAQIALLWFVFSDFWERLAIATTVLLIFESFFVKYLFPHYLAPAMCLILYLQIAGLRRLWYWNPVTVAMAGNVPRSARRRAARANKQERPTALRWRGFVTLLPLACVISLGLRVAARLNGWEVDVHGPERGALLMDDWSLRRAELERWLEQQPTPQLVFVRYSPRHNVVFEWVYNHADIMRSHVIWARDLGAEHNRLLLQQLPDRTVWSLEADSAQPQLDPYDQTNGMPGPQNPARVRGAEQEVE